MLDKGDAAEVLGDWQPSDLLEKAADVRLMIREALASSKPGRPCVMMFHEPYKWTGGPCPRSFGNIMHAYLSGLVLAVVLDATVVQNTPFECSGLLKFRRDFPIKLPRVGRYAIKGTGVEGVPFECLLRNTTNPLRLVRPGMCTYVGPAVNAQEMAALAFAGGGGGSSRVHRLFSLGAHFAFGAIFQHAFEISPAVQATAVLPQIDLQASDRHLRSSADDGPPLLRVSVHMRHANASLNGSEAIATFAHALEAIVARWSRTVAPLPSSRAPESAAIKLGRVSSAPGASPSPPQEPPRPSCTVLLATDRPLARVLFAAEVRRIGCSLFNPAARDGSLFTPAARDGGPSGPQDTPNSSAATSRTAEHGSDVEAGAIRDVGGSHDAMSHILYLCLNKF